MIGRLWDALSRWGGWTLLAGALAVGLVLGVRRLLDRVLARTGGG
jgi:hypothetical protein